MSRFETALKFEFDRECVYDQKKNVILEFPDGRATKYGMEQEDVEWGCKNIPKFATLQIKDLQAKGASDLFYFKYWLPALCNKLPAGFAEVVFDIAVNNGVRESALLLQRSVNAEADGQVGPRTLAAVFNAGSTQLRFLLELREQLYRSIAASHPHLQGDLPGWINRNNLLAEFVHV